MIEIELEEVKREFILLPPEAAVIKTNKQLTKVEKRANKIAAAPHDAAEKMVRHELADLKKEALKNRLGSDRLIPHQTKQDRPSQGQIHGAEIKRK